MSLTPEQFDELMVRSFGGALFDGVDDIAVGVSGGGDSMALLWLLQGWCLTQGKSLHALSVDHGLRVEAQDECTMVADYCAEFDHVHHHVLTWNAPSDVRVQEEARKARYGLMADYCDAHGIAHLFLGHHADDQAETVLFRLAKGSGLDGLSGMRRIQVMGALALCRPLLDVSKLDLVALCEAQDIPFIDDPSNDDDQFARVRLRQSMDILANEGLTSKRLSVTALRIARARDALDDIARKTFNNNVLGKNTNRIDFNTNLCESHDEILLRVLQFAMADIGLDRSYAARMERVEDLAFALKHDVSFRKRTLGGVIFERDDANGCLILVREKDNEYS